MISSLVEGWIKKFCGKFIRDFDSSKVNVTLTGTIELHKIELRTEEFRSYNLPYYPAFVYIDKLSLDLPVLLSTQFSFMAKDALIIVQKGADVSELDAFTAQKTLQIILGVCYLNLTTAMRAMDGGNGGVSAVELEYGFKSSDRLSLTLENVHFRIEEDDYSSYFPFKKDPRSSSIDSDGQGDIFKKPTVLGFIIDKVCLQPPTSEDISEDSVQKEESVWSDDSYAIRDRSISVNKILRIDGLSVYCGKEYSAIPGKHDERVRIHKQKSSKGMDFQSATNVEDSVVLGGNNDDDSEADDCSSDASTDDGEDKGADEKGAEGDSEDGDEEEGDMGDVGGEDGEISALGEDGFPTPAYLGYLSRSRPQEDEILRGLSLTVRASVVYQTDNQVFGPLRMHVKLSGADVHLNDAQTTYISELVLALKEYVHSLQRKCMMGCLTCSGSGLRTIDGDGRKSVDVSRRARLRWRMIRNSIRKDWHGYASSLREGSLRWRAWFAQWRLCARYIALRELLIFHVGFEGDQTTAPTPFKLYETLLMDHGDASGSGSEQGNGSGSGDNKALRHASPQRQKAWRGSGAITEGVVRTAETLVRAKIAGPANTRGTVGVAKASEKNTSSTVGGDGEEGAEQGLGQEETGISFEEICAPGSVAALMLSSRTLRALYAMQLELDALLPLHAVAFCRYWADERFRRQRDKMQAIDAARAGSQQEADDGAAGASTKLRGGSKAVLLVGVLDAVNLTAGSLGMSRLEASCVVRAHQFGVPAEGGGQEVLQDCHAFHTKVSTARVSASTGTALCAWGQVFELELDEERCPAGQYDLEVECNCRGVFSPAYGNLVAPLEVVLGSGHNGSDATEALQRAREREAALAPEEATEYLARQLALSFEGPLNTVHANLDTDRTAVHASGVEPKVRDARRRAGASAMRTAADEVVSVRLYSQLVVGTAAAVADRKNKLQQMAASAISERREVAARAQAMANRLGVDDDEDDDEMFVLDPTSLTIQHLRFTMEVAGEDPVRLTQSALYAVPSALVDSGHKEGLGVAELQPVPFLRASLGGMKVRINASNNPWIGEGQVMVQKIAVELVAPEEEGGTTGKMQPVLLLPPVDLSLSLAQTSTTGRLLGSFAHGGSPVDESCFDWRVKGTLGPFSVSIKPPSDAEASHKSDYSSSEVVWQSYRPLAHLFKPVPGFVRGWSRGIFSPKVGSEDGSAPAAVTPEAAMRLGDHYTTFPQFRNSLHMVSAATTVPRPEGDEASLSATGPLAPQRTGVSLYTQSRQMSVDLNFAPTRSALVQGMHGAAERRGQGQQTEQEQRPAAIWGMFGGSGGVSAPVDRGGASKEAEESRASALEKLHASQMERERREHREREDALRKEVASLREELERARGGAGESK